MKVKIKDKVKTKVAKVKAKVAKVKEKVKGPATAVAALALVAALAGCMDTNPASRATTANVTINVRNEAGSNTVDIAIHDVAQASADSAGSTETQSATPSMSIPVRIDARYNDAIAAATPASKAVIGSLREGLGAVLDLMASGKDGKVNAKTADGKDVVVKCSGGQCSICEDCEL